MLADRRIKIVATIGPSTSSHENLERAVRAGMNVARLNFSHGKHSDHLPVIESLQKISSELQAPVAILQDLQGPKIRVGKLKGGKVELKEGDAVFISPDYDLGEGNKITTDFKELPQVVHEGAKILLDDGLLELKVLKIRGNEVECQVIYGGILKDRKGINLPGLPLPVECMTEKDLDDLEFGLSQNVDYVALSFVRKGSDIKKLRSLIEEKNPGIKIVAKIEMLEALDNLEEIISLSDAVMVARGDLAVEVGQAQLPRVQKRIIALANELKKPVITATQMLDSMVENPRPTRAEITDVANAVLDGSDALMLSAETASGKYPFKCISTMHEISMEVEKEGRYFYDIDISDQEGAVPETVAASACLSAKRLNASAIICLTSSGRTATLISSFRPKSRIIAATNKLETLNRLELVWGIQTFLIQSYKTTDEAMDQVRALLLEYGLAEKGDHVILTLGMPVLAGAKTNTVRIYQLTDSIGALKQRLKVIPLRCQS
ncbi:MAG: pyruvate kinase [Bdellovibrionales bacterium]|nr:pyruvate kinase [Bdellovibrionales bacterium]